MKRPTEELSPEEIQRRRDSAIKRMLATPHKPHKPLGLKKVPRGSPMENDAPLDFRLAALGAAMIRWRRCVAYMIRFSRCVITPPARAQKTISLRHPSRAPQNWFGRSRCSLY